MATTKNLPVKALRLDLKNFRTVPQKDELSALHAMVSINQDRFWALMESLLDTGYLPTENIIVLEDSKGIYHVREGNRRIGALKIAFNYLSSTNLSVPDHTKITLEDVLRAWRWAFDRKAGHDVGDQDAIDVFDEITRQIRGLWDSGTDLMQQSDACIDFLFQHLEVPKKRTKR